MPFSTPVSLDTPAGLFNQNCPVIDPNFVAPVVFGGKVYVIAARTQAPLTAAVYRSSDGGLTWVALDAGAAPAYVQNMNATIGTGKFRVAVDDAGHNFLLYDFDFTTETWSALVTTAPDTGSNVKGLWFDGAGNTVLVWMPIGGPKFAIKCTIFNGAAWGPAFNVDTANTFNGGGSGNTGSPNLSGCIDGTTLHLVYTSQDISALPDIHYVTIYQQVDTGAGTLGPTTTFPLETNSFSAVGGPAIFGSSVVIPFFTDNLGDPNNRTCGCYTGDKTAGGPFTFQGPIDPDFGTDPTLIQVADQCGFAGAGGGTLYLTYCCQNSGATNIRGRCRMLSTTDLITWTGATVYDSTVTPGLSVVRISTVNVGSLLTTFSAVSAGSLALLFTPFTSPAPAATVSPIIWNPAVITLPDPRKRC